MERLAGQRIRIRGLASYGLAPPHPPALVLGYGRLPLAAIDAAVDQLVAAARMHATALRRTSTRAVG